MALASSSEVVVSSLKVAAVVGTLLVLINHGDALTALEIDGPRLFKIALTYLVPYCVSTYASVSALRAVHSDVNDTVN